MEKNKKRSSPSDTIVALATPSGAGAIAVLRLSGSEAISICASVFQPPGKKNLLSQPSHTVHFGRILDENTMIDEVLVTLFRTPHSYTGEDVVEISCHGSLFIQTKLIALFLRSGCRMAEAGEFTKRAFLGGKLDLSQAEAVADLIASESAASHRLALQQMRGSYSDDIKRLRGELIDFASLIELELDFAEEDVHFADYKRFRLLIDKIQFSLQRLIDSFADGNVMKHGIPIAIVGKPNVGKSTLLNILLGEERAIVSPVAGTTRDAIEDYILIAGVQFRFIDTAGIRIAQDEVEQIGIDKTLEKMQLAHAIIYMYDLLYVSDDLQQRKLVSDDIQNIKTQYPDKQLILLANKFDLTPAQPSDLHSSLASSLLISAKYKKGIKQLSQALELIAHSKMISSDIVVSNARHHAILSEALKAMIQVDQGMQKNISKDLLASDVREALHQLGLITGEVTTEDLLGHIFSSFCIGK